MSAAVIPMFVILIFIIFLPFIVGGFVYCDAKQHDMNAIYLLSSHLWR